MAVYPHLTPNMIARHLTYALTALRRRLPTRIRVGIRPADAAPGTIVLFPLMPNTLCCGLAGLIAVRRTATETPGDETTAIDALVDRCEARPLSAVDGAGAAAYLGGADTLEKLLALTRRCKREGQFLPLYADPEAQEHLVAIAERLERLIQQESGALAERMGRLNTEAADVVLARQEQLKDVHWGLTTELIDNIAKIRDLMGGAAAEAPPKAVGVYRKLNAVLNSIDRLEVRGRDSAGISLLFILQQAEAQRFREVLNTAALKAELEARSGAKVLVNRGLNLVESQSPTGQQLAVTVTYKVAAEIGSLGDNIRFLRRQIAEDQVLGQLAVSGFSTFTVSSHTRWASVGAITEPNCHPVDNARAGDASPQQGVIHVCLNGDIDNYLALKSALEAEGIKIPANITTDTKVIPLQIEHYLRQGHPVEDAFRLAVNDFEGSHAISMHTDLAPGKFFLSQKGSGQAVFVGISEDHYMPASEVYGFVEETDRFVKMNGEQIFEGPKGPVQGQIFILDQESEGGLGGITAMYHDGTPLELKAEDLQTTEITSRDIDRQDYPHYFLKEISESPRSVEMTLQNRWKVAPEEDTSLGEPRHIIALDENAFPPSLTRALEAGQIRRVYFVGQGTAGIAAQACADILGAYAADPELMISALKASELSGFRLADGDAQTAMADTLVVAISQSGTTTDTNRTVDMVRERGAHTLAIVNRRDSDLTFKVDGVIYTSSGRDIEMSVASTKAFYSQIVAGALLSLKVAAVLGRRNEQFISNELKELGRLPHHMRRVLDLREKIAASAMRLAPARTYWAAVGSGPNKAAADEIRIKLSELCYKTISSDYVEDKKHIDLSSEPLIIVCAAGTSGTVIGDIIKDTAIFKAHKATPVVIADEGEERFREYAADLFEVPAVSPHLAPILNTLVGHIWGYYAALAINEGSRFLHDFRSDLQTTIDRYADDGLDIYEVVLEKSFREKIAAFYNRFRDRRREGGLPAGFGFTADLTLLLKYLTGRLPVSDFEIDFNVKGTAANMLKSLYGLIGEAINQMSRPVDAIKHQAKTVTVGTSRISEKVEGILFDALGDHGIGLGQLINRNIIVLKNLQGVIAGINGSILYRIDNLNLLGEVTDETTIEVLRKGGILAQLPSRVEGDNHLKGTKRIIVRQGNVYIGKGRKDGRSIVVIPVIGSDPARPNQIANLLLLNIAFKEVVPLADKIKALGGKFEHIKNIVQESSAPWEDSLIDLAPLEDLFGLSAEKIGEQILMTMGDHR
jgi:glucosamine--fructose-6-phosphate aminotransferase (isomerizing)